jgi:hypothetical protein
LVSLIHLVEEELATTETENPIDSVRNLTLGSPVFVDFDHGFGDRVGVDDAPIPHILGQLWQRADEDEAIVSLMVEEQVSDGVLFLLDARSSDVVNVVVLSEEPKQRVVPYGFLEVVVLQLLESLVALFEWRNVLLQNLVEASHQSGFVILHGLFVYSLFAFDEMEDHVEL